MSRMIGKFYLEPIAEDAPRYTRFGGEHWSPNFQLNGREVGAIQTAGCPFLMFAGIHIH